MRKIGQLKRRLTAPATPKMCLLSLVCLIAGCAEPPPHFSVSGKVTLGDEPLAGATVSFVPIDDAGSPSFAITDENGEYRLAETRSQSGALAGEYRVSIFTYVQARPEQEPPIAGIRERVPRQYNIDSELSVTVKPEENVCDFPLESGGEIFQPQE